jgi:hypothetical protein
MVLSMALEKMVSGLNAALIALPEFGEKSRADQRLHAVALESILDQKIG